ncbi:hypothetical protein L3Q72_02190 [Vibrio sp. JC009]|uniref:protein YgfX n=1 Tax=Vibrio sp. JC009 TaxID=2912314 RepID=UPI0023B0F0AC|nr:protein YgfX [Vibrio sp. JC009]WED22237.1 hypothetical protein L3Q72_02190 [Vibrio sp. JC009]
MLPTTSPKSVNLYLQPSLIAQVIQLVVSVVIIWAILISPVCLVASAWMLAYLFSKGVRKSQAGQLKIAADKKLIWNGVEDVFRFAETLFRPMCVVIHSQSGQKITVWRDSCREEDYRHLMVVISNQPKD